MGLQLRSRWTVHRLYSEQRFEVREWQRASHSQAASDHNQEQLVPVQMAAKERERESREREREREGGESRERGEQMNGPAGVMHNQCPFMHRVCDKQL